MSRPHSRSAAALTAIVCCLSAAGGAASAADGGGGTYRAAGNDYDFALVNTGTTAWHRFSLVAPAGTIFVGGTTGNEASATCVVDRPDRIECGPLPPTLMPPEAQIPFVAATTSSATCVPTFALFVSSSDSGPYVAAGNVVAAAGCGRRLPRALTPPSLRGIARVGGILRVIPPQWSAKPSRVAFRWERCTVTGCVGIADAAKPWLRLTAADAGRTVRVVVTATIAGVQLRTESRPILIHAAR